MTGIPQGNTYSREKFCTFLVRNRMKQVQTHIHGIAKSIQRIYNVQTRIYETKDIYINPYHVHTRYIHVHTCIYIQVCVHTCSDHVYTRYIHPMYKFMGLWTWNIKSKNLQSCAVHTSKLPWPLSWCYQHDCYHYNSYSIWFLFYLEVGDTRQERDQLLPPPQPWHCIPSIDVDCFKADSHCKAGLWVRGCNVVAHSWLIEEQPATWKVAGCCSIDTD